MSPITAARRFVQSEPALRFREAWGSPKGRTIRNRAEIGFGFLAAAYLVLKLSDIGWGDLLAALPTQPLFYLLVIPRLLVLPASEIVIYRRLWETPKVARWGVFLRKQAYNMGILEYSGELYFAGWAPRALNLAASRALVAIRDVNILSAMVMNVFAVAIFATLVVSGEAHRLFAEAPAAGPYFAVGGAFVAVITGAGLIFHKRLIGLQRDETRFVCGVHAVRILILLGLQIAQWSVALPHAPLEAWLIFLAANIALTRIPMIPSRELVFAGLSLSLTGMIEAPRAEAAAVLALAPALMQLGYLAILLGTSFRKRAG